MKKGLSVLLVLVMLLSLCACSKNDTQITDPSQTTNGSTEESTNGTTEGTQAPTADSTGAPTDAPTEAPTTAPTEAPATTPAACSHTYKDATCTAPKTCTKCGATEGSAAGHNWNAATCTAAKTCTKCGATEGSAAGHNWSVATCTAPKTCSTCGATEGSAAGHNWSAATCTAPKTCSTCGATEGSAAGHAYSNGACTVCGAADPNVPFTNNRWTAHIVIPSTSSSDTRGEVLCIYTLSPTDFQGYTHKEYYSNPNYGSDWNINYYGTITHGDKTYYDFWSSSEMNGITWVDNGNTVTVTFAYSEPVTELVLTRTGEKQFTVTSSNDAHIPVGTVFNQD